MTLHAEYQKAYRAKQFVKIKMKVLKDQYNAIFSLYKKELDLYLKNKELWDELNKREKKLNERESKLDKFAQHLRIKEFNMQTGNVIQKDYLQIIYDLKQQARELEKMGEYESKV